MRALKTMGRAALLCLCMALLTVGLMLTAGVHATPTAQAGWHTLYTRPGWSGGTSVDLRAVGDVMLARHVAALADRAGPATLLAKVQPLLGGDVTVGNLESPLTERREERRPGPYRLVAPPALAAALPAAGFDLLSLANNHGLDGGPAGLGDTLATLRSAGVQPIGGGVDEAATSTPVWVKTSGLRLAVLAFNDVLDPADGPATLAPADDLTWPNPDFAGCPSAGERCAFGRAWLSARALKAVATARGEADAVVVLVHWGVEYASQPSARQRAWAARLVAAGADVVLGAHPHVLQPAEWIAAGARRGFVAYSLGNFLFDGPADPAQSSGAALRVLLDHDGVALVAVAPVATAAGRPYQLDIMSEAAQAALAALGLPLAATRPGTPTATPTSGAVTAWRWDGATAQPVLVPAGVSVPPHLSRIAADLRGDGTPVWASLDAAGVVTVRAGSAPDAPVVWTNERPGWRFTRLIAGDPNDDGRIELLLLLWQPDAAGHLHTQPYLLGWRGGRYRIIWGGSATGVPVQDVALADLDADGRSELVALEGGAQAGDLGDHVSVWHWHGWGFQLEWRSPTGRWATIGLCDVDNDGAAELVAGT